MDGNAASIDNNEAFGDPNASFSSFGQHFSSFGQIYGAQNANFNFGHPFFTFGWMEHVTLDGAPFKKTCCSIYAIFVKICVILSGFKSIS